MTKSQQLSRNINDLLDTVQDSREELIESESFLDRMINYLPTGIFLIDPETREIVEINRHALNLLERTREEVIGKKCMGLTCFTEDPLCHKMKPGETSNILQTKIISKSGREVPIAKFISHIERKNKVYILETLTDITEIARARSELEKATEELERKVRDRTIRLSTIIDTVMNGIIVLNDRLEINFFSTVAEELSGYRSDEVLNRKIMFLMAEPYRTEIINALENYNGGGKPRLIGKRHKVIAIRKGGETFSMEIAVNETYINGERYYVAVMRDITDELRAQETLAREKERLEEMLETSPIGVGISVGNRIKYANNALKNMGMRVNGKNSSPFNRKDFDRAGQSFDTEGYLSNFELKMTSPEGQKDILLSLYPYDYDGQEALLGWHVDITAQKAVERELAEAKETAEEATRVKSDFLANMSHEIRTPMNAIIGLSHLAMQSGLNGKQMNYISKVYRAAENLLAILNDILDYSKIEAGKIELEHMDFLLEDLFHDLDGILGHAREKKEIELIFDLSPDTPSYVTGDPVRLQQILDKPCQQRGEIHQRGGDYHRSPRRGEKGGLPCPTLSLLGEGHGNRHNGKTAAKAFQGFFPGGQLHDEKIRGDRPGTGHFKKADRSYGRGDMGGEPPGRGKHIPLYRGS